MYICAICGAEFDEPRVVLNNEFPAYDSDGELLGLEQEYLYLCPICDSSCMEEK